MKKKKKKKNAPFSGFFSTVYDPIKTIDAKVDIILKVLTCKTGIGTNVLGPGARTVFHVILTLSEYAFSLKT